MKTTEITKKYGARELTSNTGRSYFQFPNQQSYNDCKERAKVEGIEGLDITCFDSVDNSIYFRRLEDSSVYQLLKRI